MRLPASLQHKADTLVAAREAQIPQQYRIQPNAIPQNSSRLVYTCGLLSAREQEIISLDATDLAERIAEKQYTTVEVTKAYIGAATIVHSATNCLTWLDAKRALQQATELDQRMAEAGPVGPLHGVPISAKDFVQIVGMPQSGGDLRTAGFVPEEDAMIIDILRKAGAVFIAKTTMPQSIMQLETESFWGVTTNAHNRNLTSSGSSGGEGALVGAYGSPIGITTDVGGSTRSPAAHNGLWGFKPSSKRFPRRGVPGVTMVSRISGSIGPVAHSLRDMNLFCKVLLLDAEPWKRDVTLVAMPWKQVDLGEKRIRIGLMRDDGIVRPVAPVRRAIEAMTLRLRQSPKFEVVEISQPDFTRDVWELTKSLYYIDGGKRLRDTLGEEPMLPLTEWITQGARELTREEVTDLVNKRNTLRQRYADFYNDLKLDAILSPVSPAPAQPHGATKYWNYTSFWNCLDWPAMVFPTGLKVELGDTDDQIARNDDERHLYSTYSPEGFIDAPIGLQLCRPRWQDEELFAVAREIDLLLPL